MTVRGPFQNAGQAEAEANRLRGLAASSQDPKWRADAEKFARQLDIEAERLRNNPGNARRA